MQNNTTSAEPKVYPFEADKVYHFTGSELAAHMIAVTEMAYRGAAESILNGNQRNVISVLEYISSIGKK